MNRVALAFLTKDRVELSRQSIEPLLHHDKFDLFWMDGSATEEGKNFPPAPGPSGVIEVHHKVRGGADAAIVYALTTLLNHSKNYTHVGLVENDVLLDPDWFDPTFALFEQGRQDGLDPGAVSARCYVDRILVQRDGYALMHNLGSGMAIYTRDAARLILDHYRTGWTMTNRAVFSQLSDVDIGGYWAFKGGEHWLTADWYFDTVLAAHGYASLALTPSPCQMIGQDPPLEAQGLILATSDVVEYAGATLETATANAFSTFATRTALIRNSYKTLPLEWVHRDPRGNYLYFPHQLGVLNPNWGGDWRLKWSQSFGPFSWQAGKAIDDIRLPTLDVRIFGPCDILLGGSEHGGRVKIVDTFSGFEAIPELPRSELGQILAINVPGSMRSREIGIVALDPGVTFYGLSTAHSQPWLTNFSKLRDLLRFDHSCLPPV